MDQTAAVRADGRSAPTRDSAEHVSRQIFIERQNDDAIPIESQQIAVQLTEGRDECGLAVKIDRKVSRRSFDRIDSDCGSDALPRWKEGELPPFQRLDEIANAGGVVRSGKNERTKVQ
jgi:hypothetical protein